MLFLFFGEQGSKRRLNLAFYMISPKLAFYYGKSTIFCNKIFDQISLKISQVSYLEFVIFPLFRQKRSKSSNSKKCVEYTIKSCILHNFTEIGLLLWKVDFFLQKYFLSNFIENLQMSYLEFVIFPHFRQKSSKSLNSVPKGAKGCQRVPKDAKVCQRVSKGAKECQRVLKGVIINKLKSN